MTAEELLERYAAGERDFQGVNLRRAELGGANLSGIVLSNSDLGEAFLEGANLEGANLERANLCFTNLFNANLKFGNLKHIVTQETVFANANLEGANLTNSQIHATVAGANFRNAIVKNTQFIECFCNDTIWSNGEIMKGSSHFLLFKRSIIFQTTQTIGVGHLRILCSHGILKGGMLPIMNGYI